MNQPRYILKNLSIDEVSFVDVGANPLAKVIFSKRQDPGKEPMEPNSFAITKEMSNYALVAKCLHAARSGSAAGISRNDIDAALDSIAKGISDANDISYTDAYELMMDGDGAQLYALRELCPAEGVAPAIQKQDDAVSKAAERERAAVQLHERYGMDLATARQQVHDYYRQ